MDLLWNITTILSIFLLIEEVSLKQIWLNSKNSRAPLSLIRSKDATLRLAEPQIYSSDYVTYIYDEKSLQEKFFVACPGPEFISEFILKQKLENSNLSNESKLLVAVEYTSNTSECNKNLQPSIEKSNNKDDDGKVKLCGKSEAEFYDVGYPVMEKGSKKDIKFMPIYKICYSAAENEGLFYTVHRIVSPKIMLNTLWEFYELRPENPFKTSLDKRDITDKSLYEKNYLYQFVGSDDMPTMSWNLATLFSINYTLISKHKDILRGMLTVDNYIRLFSKKTDQPLTLYSGSYQKLMDIPIDSFWRIIMDDKGNAIIIITQHTKIACDQTYICNKNRVVVQEYEKGGCTYMCSVDDKIIKLLGLIQFKEIKGDLALTFPREIPPETPQSSQDEPQSSAAAPSKDISILDFMGKPSFASVLKDIDPQLGKIVKVLTITTR